MLCEAWSVAPPLCATASVASYSGKRQDSTERSLHTKDFYFRFRLEAVFKVLQTSLRQALPFPGTLFKDTSQLPKAQNGFLPKWALLRTQMCSFHLRRDPVQECLLLSLPCLHASQAGMLLSCPRSPEFSWNWLPCNSPSSAPKRLAPPPSPSASSALETALQKPRGQKWALCCCPAPGQVVPLSSLLLGDPGGTPLWPGKWQGKASAGYKRV